MDVFLNGVVHVVIQIVDICISIARACDISLHSFVMPTVWAKHDRHTYEHIYILLTDLSKLYYC